MRTIYIDAEFRCHTSDPGGAYTAVETDVFDGKCDTWIAGYRYLPAGETWTREDGAVFHGEMLAPVTDFARLASAQRQYEALLAELAAAYGEGVNSL